MKERLLSSFVIFAGVASLSAGTIDLYVDAAPNVFGSPDYSAWWADAQAGAMDGSFVNMANSFNPANAGTTQYAIEDVAVYSFGDLGARLHFVYFVAGETIDSLKAKNFQVRLDYEWDGVSYEGFNWGTPSRWLDTADGVVGTTGWAWWAAYGVNTQVALDADLAAWKPYAGDITFSARMDGAGPASIIARHDATVPDGGATALLLAFSSLGMALLRKRA